jgi:hypothetical protein
MGAASAGEGSKGAAPAEEDPAAAAAMPKRRAEAGRGRPPTGAYPGRREGEGSNAARKGWRSTAVWSREGPRAVHPPGS